MSRKKKGSRIDGVLLLNKGVGLSSNKALQQVKILYGAMKAGHTGSLDPLACGLLPICFGQATRLSSYLLDTNKRYRVRAQLGVCTSTGDAEGAVISRKKVANFSVSQIETVLNEFMGEILQIPPMYSALKQNGKRLYELARQGIEVERKARSVTIHELDLLKVDSDVLELDVLCSKGTYIRTLLEDIGNALECGAFVQELIRTEVGSFQLRNAWNIDQLQSMASNSDREKCLLPPDAVVRAWPKLQFSDQSVYCARQGQVVSTELVPMQGWVRMYTNDQKFFGIGEVIENNKIAPRKLFSGLD